MLRVCIVFGGASNEHEVSLRSATCVLENIDRSKYEVVMMGISRQGQWYYYDGPIEFILSGKWESSSFARPALLSPNPQDGGIILLEEADTKSTRLRTGIIGGSEIKVKENSRGLRIISVDLVFPVLHGKNGEDGTIQGLLELAGIPYVGGGVLSSAACMDKEIAHILLTSAGIRKTSLISAQGKQLRDTDRIADRIDEEIGYPVFVKPANAGSSVGITKVKERSKLRGAIKFAAEHDDKVIFEKAVVGREVECAVIGNLEPEVALAIGEIIPDREFYDYHGKYLDDTAQLVAPAEIDDDTAQELHSIAIKAYQVMGCRGLARVDFFVEADGGVVLNEINTMPGFTSISMFPRLFCEDGVTITKTIDKLIGFALDK